MTVVVPSSAFFRLNLLLRFRAQIAFLSGPAEPAVKMLAIPLLLNFMTPRPKPNDRL